MNTPDPNSFKDDNDYGPAVNSAVIFAFLSFHRRAIFGGLLVAALGVFLWYVTAEEPRDKKAKAVDEISSTAKREPRDTSNEKNVFATDSRPDADKSTPELIEIDLGIKASWASRSPALAVPLLNRRLRILSILRSRELSETQQEYCLVSQIETIGHLFAVSERGNLNMDNLEPELQNLDQQFSDHSDPLLASKANLILLRTSMQKYLSGKLDFDQIKNEIASRRASICASQSVVREFGEVLIAFSRITGNPPEIRNVVVENLVYMDSIDRPMAQQVALNYFFPGIQIGNLAPRVRNRSADADSDVESLYSALEKFPNFPLDIYSVAASTVRSYQKNGESQKATEFLDRLKRIEAMITDDSIRSEVKKGIGMLEATASN